MNGIIEYAVRTGVCFFILFNIMFVRSMKLVLVAVNHFYCTVYYCMFTPQFLLFILLSMDRFFLILNIMNNAAMNFLYISFGSRTYAFVTVPSTGMVGS